MAPNFRRNPASGNDRTPSDRDHSSNNRYRNLPVEFQGLRVVQLSDVHHSPFLDEERINEAVRMANDLRPDLVALTGDSFRIRVITSPLAPALWAASAPRTASSRSSATMTTGLTAR